MVAHGHQVALKHGVCFAVGLAVRCPHNDALELGHGERERVGERVSGGSDNQNAVTQCIRLRNGQPDRKM